VGEFIQTKLGIHEPTQQFFEKLNHKFGTMFCAKSANFTGHQFLRPTQNVSPSCQQAAYEGDYQPKQPFDQLPYL
jgi:hypothetical protein